MKPLLKSKTFWWNTITLVVAVSEAFLQITQDSSEFYKWLFVINAIGNQILRFYTKTGIKGVK